MTTKKYQLYQDYLATLDSGSSLTYAPIIRQALLFNFPDSFHQTDISQSLSAKVHGRADSSLFPEKKEIFQVGYIEDEDFFKGLLASLNAKGVESKKISIGFGQLEALRLSQNQSAEVLSFAEFTRRQAGVDIGPVIKRQLGIFNYLVPRFYQVIKESGVDAIILRCYYKFFYFPVIFVCKMLGVTVIDVQHGINGFVHPCYSGFSRQEKDTPLLPDVFWCWSSFSKQMLESDSHLRHVARTIIGGFPQITSKNPPMQRDKVLYSHQPRSKGVPIPVTTIAEAQHLSGKSVTVRPHPLHVQEGQEARDKLVAEGIKCHIEDPREVSIHESLCESSLHVTYSSTCALDGLNYGVPSICSSDNLLEIERRFNTGLIYSADCIEDAIDKSGKGDSIDYSLGTEKKISIGTDELLGRAATFP